MKKILNILLTFVILFSCFIPPYEYRETKADGFTYGIVDFKIGGSRNIYYTDAITGKSGYLNSGSVADAAFLGYDASGRIKFKTAGVTGVLKSNDGVTIKSLYPEVTPVYVSYYRKENGLLKHYINVDTTRWSGYSTVTLGIEDVGLQENVEYYSYDGHYFYLQFKDMIDDYLNGTYTRAVNANNPYFNYYQYLSNRSISNHSLDNMQAYINSMFVSKPPYFVDNDGNNIHDIANQSQLYGEQLAFMQYQNEYGVNGYLTFGVAMNESARGRSAYAVKRNNLFGHEAYDSNPDAATDYATVSQAIMVHDANYISDGYLDPCDGRDLLGGGYQSNKCHLGRYFGAHLGDKASGVNVKYASDPFWGEKAASYYYAADAQNGLKDYKKYTIGIKTLPTSNGVWKEPTTASHMLYETGSAINYAYLILDTVSGESINGNNVWYKIQSDPVLNSDRTKMLQSVKTYNYNNNYAYVHSSAIQVIKPGTQPAKRRYNITFQPNGGTWSMDKLTTNKTVTTEEYATPTIDTLYRDGYTFLGWSETVTAATEDKTYVARWRSNTEYEITFNTDGGVFSDGTNQKKVIIPKDEVPTVEVPTKDGYIFVNWSPMVGPASGDTTYTAVWRKIPTYDIVFDANGGIFPDGKSTQKQEIRENQMPVSAVAPTKEGYVFAGWDKEITAATANTTYKAVWKKGTIEDFYTQKEGLFYFNYLKEMNGKLMLQGYQTIQGIDNSLNNDIRYIIVYKNVETGEEVRTSATRITKANEIPKPVYSPDGFDYTYSWFNAELDIDQLPVGNYQLYVLAYTDQYYAKSLISNKGYKEQVTNHSGKNQVVTTGNNYDSNNSYVELMIRNQWVAKKTGSYIYNQYDKYTTFEFTNDHKLHLYGNVYSYGMDLGLNTSVTRKIVFENKKTYQSYIKDLGSLENGGYQVFLPVEDNLSKSRAWYDAIVDVSDIPVGEYVIYLTTSSNITDINKMTEKMGRNLDGVKATINKKNYSFKVNKSSGSRIEMKVE